MGVKEIPQGLQRLVLKTSSLSGGVWHEELEGIRAQLLVIQPNIHIWIGVLSRDGTN